MIKSVTVTKKEGYQEVEIEYRYLFGIVKIIDKYSCKEWLIGKYGQWVKEPTKELCGDGWNHQLDKWVKECSFGL